MLYVHCPRGLIERFKRQAKKAFPRETMAYLYGTVAGDTIHIDGLYVPEGLERYCTKSSITLQPHWAEEAIEAAKEEDGVVVGTIHSHPYTKEELELINPEHEQSQADIDSCGLAWEQLSGICLVRQTKSGRLRASVRLWGPTVPVKVEMC